MYHLSHIYFEQFDTRWTVNSSEDKSFVMATKHVDVPNTNLAQFQIERMRTYGDAVAMVTIWVND